ncbi:OTU domain, ubiquitin aldehyde binding [Irineochytrium annulatum]|nr:OTU domain, ubiquitin aldehyde binding [Irineochytrium annulatum]
MAETTAPAAADTRPTDQEILDYERQLKEEMTGHQPLVGPLSDFSSLQLEYATGAAIFRRKIADLTTTHTGMRAIKKDGNCFYRAISYRFCEAVMQAAEGSDWRRVALERVEGTKDALKAAGYDPIITEDFFEPFRDALNLERAHGWEEKLLETFRTENRDMYEAFILDSYPSLDAFISSQVEPMSIESDQIHIVAIANALSLNINVADLDGSDTKLNFHEISPMEPLNPHEQPRITLLYRPGHYDIVY